MYLGDYKEDAKVIIFFTTNTGSGGRVDPNNAFEAADLVIYKNDSTTEKTTTNGITVSTMFDAKTGLHAITIDMSVDTGDTGFWQSGNEYICVLYPDETVDTQSVVFSWQWSINNRVNALMGGNINCR